MARLDAAWTSGDWNATVVAAATLRNAYPNDAEAAEKYRAANINAGDAAVRGGMKPAAIVYYDEALKTGWDADTAAKRLAVISTPTPTPRPATATPRPVEAPKAPLGSVGQWQQQGGMALIVVRVARLNQLDRFTIPKRGNVFVDLEVAIRNMDRDEVSYNPWYFSVRDTNGFEYDRAWGSLEPSLKSGTLQRGEQARGSVAFEVAASARGLTLLYDPIAIFGDPDMMRIDLGQ